MTVRTVSLLLLALALAVPAAAGATPANWIGVATPQTAKARKPFTIMASASFDPILHQPAARQYLAAAVFLHRGADACLTTVPFDRRGYAFVRKLDYNAGYSAELLNETMTLRAAGLYRYCGYVYTYTYSFSDTPSYQVLAYAAAATYVKR